MKTKITISLLVTASFLFNVTIANAQTPWYISGNAGTNPPTDFIGTTNKKSLLFKTGNQEQMEIDTNGHVGIAITSTPIIYPLTVYTHQQVSGGTLNSGGNFNVGIFYEGVAAIGSQSTTNHAVFGSPQANKDIILANNDGSGYNERVRVTSTGNVGIGTTTPAQKLDIAGTVQMTGFKLTTAPTNGYVLTSDASGVGTWQIAAGGIVSGSGTLNYVPKWTPNGTTLGNSSIFDNGNVGIGTITPSEKLSIIETVSTTIAQLSAKQSGGASKSYWGNFNDQLWMSAGGTYKNGWIGDNASRTIPYMVMSAGNANSYIALATTATNNTQATERMRIDKDGNMGIGTTTPNLSTLGTGNTTLTLSGTGTVGSEFYGNLEFVGHRTWGGNQIGTMRFYQDAGEVSRIFVGNGGTSAGTVDESFMAFWTKTTGVAMAERMRINKVGNVGIGTTAPSEKLEVNGNIKIPAGNSLIGSDKRLKTDIDTIKHSLDIVKQLHGIYYKWDTTVMKAKGYNFNSGRQIGFIAQSVQSVLPEIVAADNDSLGFLSLDYSRFAPVLVEAVKELAKKDSTKDVQIKTLQASDSVSTTLQNTQQQSIDSLKQGLLEEKIKTNNQDSIITSLQNQMNQLTSLINDCCNNNGNGHGNGHGNNLMQSDTNNYKSLSSTTLTEVELSNKNSIVLNQNVPNPFAEQTAISYYLPDNVQRAQILFFEQSGKIIKTVDLTEKGKGVLNVFANDLSNGMYTYSLIIDGQIIETKKMIKQ